ncbi:MAG: DNA translocase FtsK, partial [Oscillospiraceae bacterium]|nr:DNA translocase FtsK [Oscillospiraceae bacterium]
PAAAEVPPPPPAPAPPALKTEEIHSAEPPAPKSTGKRAERSAEVEAEAGEMAKIIEAAALEDGQEYRYPPVDLLQSGKAAAVDGREEMLINRERLQTTLESFSVDAKIVDITRGPTVTRYDLELAHGVKLNKLTNLADDLALSLGVSGVRIAPIPDKISTVGIEVPNKIVSIVYLREIISSDAFRSAPSKLTFAIGKDIGGKAIVGNIAKLPHMLIAGTTGSGKSVCMNSLILSLLFKASPDEVRLIMIDPKMVELGIYNGIPHLYVPVVTDPKKAAGALQWAVVEMLKRYRLFSEAGVRDLAGYNKIQTAQGGQTLPQVVIVIDELADLMMVASKEVEDSICRVAQMGRASGMHLVIATQRPSADVITGLMKANIPSRIAFAVSSGMESRIILDAQGAEKLVGNGDMLYHPLGSSKPTRIQGAFVTDEEREAVINFIKQNSEPQYNEDIEAQIEQVAEAKSAKEPEPEESGGFAEYDELLPQAVEVIFETKQASVSMLQRRLKLGYSRAARIVDQMEELGVVGPFEGSKPRQIIMTREQWEEISSGGASAVPADAADDFTTADPEDWDD